MANRRQQVPVSSAKSSSDSQPEVEMKPMLSNSLSVTRDGGVPRRTDSESSDDSNNNSNRDAKGEDEDEFGEIVKDFAEETSLLGVPRLILATTRISRLFWIVVCVVCAAMFIQGVAELLQKYLEYPKQATMSPTALYANVDDTAIIGGGILLSKFIASCSMGGNPCNMSRDFFNVFNPHYFNCYTYKDWISARATTTGKTKRPRDKSVPSEDMRDEPWLMAGLDNGLSMVVLTGSGMVDRNEKSTELLIGLYDSGSATAGSDGVRIVIHPPNIAAVPLAEGFDVPPGFAASLSVRPRRYVRIGPPHGDCVSRNPFDDQLLQSQLTDDEGQPVSPVYRQMICQQACLQTYIRDRCGCYDETLPLFNAALDPQGTTPICRSLRHFPTKCSTGLAEYGDVDCIAALMTVSRRVDCAQRVRDQVRASRRLMEECECRAACNELVYDVAYSLARWPAPGFAGDAAYDDIFRVQRFLDNFDNSNTARRHFNESGDRSRALKDFAHINVYVADPEVLVTRESPEYEWSQLISDIGGQLGVWIGISLITVAEVVEFVCQLSRLAARRHCRRSPTPRPTATSRTSADRV